MGLRLSHLQYRRSEPLSCHLVQNLYMARRFKVEWRRTMEMAVRIMAALEEFFLVFCIWKDTLLFLFILFLSFLSIPASIFPRAYNRIQNDRRLFGFLFVGERRNTTIGYTPYWSRGTKS